VESDTYDHAYIEVSNDNIIWTPVWQNTAPINESSWSTLEYDISAVADGQSTVYVRWGMGITDDSYNFSGWNIDNVVVDGDYAPKVDHFVISTIASPQTVGSPTTGIIITAQTDLNETAISFNGSVIFGGSAGITGTSVSFVGGVLSGISITPTVAGNNLTFTVDDGSAHTGLTSFTVNASASLLYNTWASTFGNPFSDTALSSNADGDSANNLLEFAFGTDPTLSDSGSLVVDGSVNGLPIPVSSNGASTFDLVFVRRDDYGTPGSLTYTPQFSSDLVTFYDNETIPIFVANSTDDADYEVVKVAYPILLPNEEEARFARIKVEEAP